ncbi:hypothetical protein ACTXT7_006096 [Hymenolepis weldensis]
MCIRTNTRAVSRPSTSNLILLFVKRNSSPPSNADKFAGSISGKPMSRHDEPERSMVMISHAKKSDRRFNIHAFKKHEITTQSDNEL